MQLYITEKPSVARALVDYFNKNGANFKKSTNCFLDSSNNSCISWAVGHLLFLPPPEFYNSEWKSWNVKYLPVCPTDYKFKKQVYKKTAEQYKTLTNLIKDASTIIHVGDPDREGQLLIDEILENKCNGKSVKRLLLSALDDKSIEDGLASIQSNSHYKGLSAAGEARGYIDWLIGMNLTRFYTNKAREAGYENVMRVGRVKAPTLKLIVDRYHEYKNHKVLVTYINRPSIVVNGEEITLQIENEPSFLSQEEAMQEHEKLSEWKLIDITTQEKAIVNKEQFSLDTLQISANKSFGFSPKKTLEILQKLYESKYVTYPRSDCKFLPTSQFKMASQIINALNKNAVLPMLLQMPSEMPVAYNDNKVTAHHAIIPTSVEVDIATLSSEEQKLYVLICKKFGEMFMPSYQLECNVAEFQGKTTKAYFKWNKILQLGWKNLYTAQDISIEEDTEENFSEMHRDNFVFHATYPTEQIKIHKRESKPRPLFTEGTIIKAMNNIQSDDANLNTLLKSAKGIGTPATRATIIEELLKENLIDLEKKKLIPTKAGENLIKILPEEITKADFTALMEQELDEVSKDPNHMQIVLEKTLDFINKVLKQQVEIAQHNEWKCPSCKEGSLRRKSYRNEDGKTVVYYRCESCNATTPADKNKPKIVTCKACNKGYFVSKKRKSDGKIFYACSSYPNCENVLSEQEFNNSK